VIITEVVGTECSGLLVDLSQHPLGGWSATKHYAEEEWNSNGESTTKVHAPWSPSLQKLASVQAPQPSSNLPASALIPPATLTPSMP